MTAWRTISVALAADTSNYVRGINQAEQSTRSFTRTTETSTEKAGLSIKQLATRGAAVAGIAVGFHAVIEAGKAMVGQAISWESAFAGVRKTVDATEAEFARLEDGIISMANSIPATREEIASVAEAAGQLGISTPAILGFTEVMIGLGEATNLSATEAATQLARLANITQMSQGDFDRLGSSVVALGNNFATTEAEIVAMSLRIASAGNQVGLTEDEILALATALSSVGIEAEAGGTAISRVIIEMASAVDEGGAKLESFAAAAGMTAEQFATLFGQDSSAAIVAFVEGLGSVEERGQSLFAVMEELGFSDVRVGNALRSMAGAGDLLAEALGVSSDAWRENTALTDEVAQRYATAESQLRIFGNQVTNIARIAGAELVPVLLGAVDSVQALAQWIGDLASKFDGQLAGGLDSVIGAGENVAEIMEAILSAAEPLAAIVAVLGGVAFVTLAEVLEFTTGAIADNADAIIALVAGYAAFRAAGLAVTVFTTLQALLPTVTASMAGLHAATLTANVSMTSFIGTVGVARGALAALTTGATGAALAVGALTAAVGLWYVSLQKWDQSGADRANKWLDDLNRDADATVESLRDRIAQVQALRAGLDDTMSTGWRAYSIDIDANRETEASRREAGKALVELEAQFLRIQGTSAATGLSIGQVEEAIAELGLDPATTSTRALVDAINEWAGANGSVTASAALAAQAAQEQEDATRDAVDAARDLYGLEQTAASAVRAQEQAQQAVADAHRDVARAQRGVTSASKGVQDAYRGVEDAARGVRDAQRGVQDALRAAAEAQDGLRRAQEDALYGTKELEQANRGVVDAEKALAQAQRDSLTAQQELDVARGLAVRNLEDLDRAARGAALSERDAVLSLAEARRRLAEPIEEDASPDERERRLLAVERAELALEEARVRAADAEAKLQEANDKGIEQSDVVVAAKDAITQAAEDEQSAEEALSAARERVVSVQESLTQRVEEAQRRVEEANLRVEESQYRLEQASYRVRDAQDAVGEAQQRLVDARAEVEAARRGVAEAEDEVGNKAMETAEAMYELETETLGAEEAGRRFHQRLQDIEAMVRPGHPLRAGLDGLIEALQIIGATGGGGEFSTVGPWKSGYVFPQKFHTGGVVPGFPGQEVPAILQAGEMVLTREQQAAFGPNPSGWYGYDLGGRGQSAGGGDQFIINDTSGNPVATAQFVSRYQAAKKTMRVP